MQKFEIIFYKNKNSEEPTKEFIINLEHKIRAKVTRAISRLEKNGTEFREPFSTHLEGGILNLEPISA